MKVIEIEKPGGPEVLKEAVRPDPVLRPGEVLVRVAAAGVNRPDVLQRTGNYPIPPGASDIPGLEVAGTIIAGSVSGSPYQIGDRVCALVAGGGYAELCAVPLGQCLPVPEGLSDLEAASLPETFFTVWTNVFDRARLAPGESLLVQGGTSGIGVAAIQMARALGHRVFATAGSDEKARACEALGAVRGINYRTEDFAVVVREMTENKGVDVILDMIGGSYLPREISALADDGRIALIALLGGAKAELDLGQVLRRRLTVSGSTLRPRSVEFKAAIAKNLETKIWPLLAEGAIKPVVYKSFALRDAAEAHRLLESSQHIGKIVLAV
jgi:NADPH2:quinone reductase